jgi:hypothetical protein
MSEDAGDFMARMKEMDKRVARHLNAIHQKRVEEVNRGRGEKPIYQVGDKVWFRRPPSLTAGLPSVWQGPCVVTRRVGQGSYQISTQGAAEQPVHEDQIKPFLEDKYAGEAIPLHYYRGGGYDNRVRPGEDEVEEIRGHQRRTDGKLMLHTKWKGRPRLIWEPVGSFVHRYSGVMAEYVQAHQLEIGLGDLLVPRAAV